MSDSIITKKAIAASLKEIAAGKSFDKISVSDITGACHLNRQTFYYHFQDKFELLDWIYYNEVFKPLTEGISFDNWNERLVALLKIMQRDKKFYMNTIKCSENYFEEYLFRILTALFETAVDALDVEKKLAEEERQIFARFYAHGLCGTIIDWALSGMKEPVEKMERHIRYLVTSSEKAAYRTYMRERRDGPPEQSGEAEKENASGE